MSILVRLARYTLRYRGHLALTYFCLAAAALLSLAVPKLIGWTIDTALEGGDEGRLVLLALLVMGFSALRGVFAYGQSYLAEYVSQRVAYDLRQEFLAHLHRLSFAYHDHQRTGDLMSRATTDVDSIRWYVSFAQVYALQVLVLIGAVAGLMLATDWGLALVALGATPPAVFIAVRMSRRLRRMWMGVQAETGRMTAVLQESLSGIRVVKTFGAEEFEREKFGVRARDVSERSFATQKLQAVNASLMSTLFAVATAVVIWYGGRQIIDGDLTPGELAQFVLYLGMLVFPIRMIGGVVNSFSRALSAGERIFQVLDAPSPVKELPGAVDLGRAMGAVKLHSVSFSYASDSPSGDAHHPQEVLRDINLDVSPGQKVALVGPPGGGKSTLVSLIPRFYDPTGGIISIDGADIRECTFESLRRNVGIVFQDVFLFMATIRENIAYGAPGTSLEEVVSAARAAELHDFVADLPDGYDTLVGERGVTLSGGQKQRLAIARTLLMDPAILILDDSTSSVDAETEALIQRALDRLVAGRTTFVIAHRVSTVKRADQILVLEDGEVADRGTHEELISRDGPYREIYELQLLPEGRLLAESASDDGGG